MNDNQNFALDLVQRDLENLNQEYTQLQQAIVAQQGAILYATRLRDRIEQAIEDQRADAKAKAADAQGLDAEALDVEGLPEGWEVTEVDG